MSASLCVILLADLVCISDHREASLVAQMVKNLPALQETSVQSLGWEDPQRREWLPTPIFLPAEFHGQRNLAGYSPWGCKESDTTGQISLFHFFSQVLTDSPLLAQFTNQLRH